MASWASAHLPVCEILQGTHEALDGLHGLLIGSPRSHDFRKFEDSHKEIVPRRVAEVRGSFPCESSRQCEHLLEEVSIRTTSLSVCPIATLKDLQYLFFQPRPPHLEDVIE